MQEEDETKAAGIVLKELQKGYNLKDRILTTFNGKSKRISKVIIIN